MSILDDNMCVTMPDGSVMAVPVSVIANNRAASYAEEFNGDLKRSLDEDTVPMFEDDHFEIVDWAANNMNWSEVADFATLVQKQTIDFQEGWMNGCKCIVQGDLKKYYQVVPLNE